MCQSHYALLSAYYSWISGEDEDEDSFIVCPSRSTLALEAGLSLSDMDKRQAELRDAGLVVARLRKNTSSEYRIFRTAGNWDWQPGMDLVAEKVGHIPVSAPASFLEQKIPELRDRDAMVAEVDAVLTSTPKTTTPSLPAPVATPLS